MTTAPEDNKLRFAVMARQDGLQKWQTACYLSLIKSGLAENVLWIVENETLVHQSFFQKLSHYPWRKFLFRKYYKHFLKPDGFPKIAIPEIQAGIPEIHCSSIRKGKYSEYFSESDLRTIQSYKPDFILKFGFGIIRGEILHAAKYGVWSFHHGDEQKYRGVPPGFHEIMQSDPKTASILQRLTETLDGGIILRKGYFKTINHSWSANLDQAFNLSLGWPTDVCRELLVQKTFPAALEGVKTHAPVYKEPENFSMLLFLKKLLFNKIRFHLNELFLAENWATGLIKAGPESFVNEQGYCINPKAVYWLGAKERNRYWADSFAVDHGENLLLLFENYDYRQQKANLLGCTFHKESQTFGEVTESLTEPWHLSYPFLFKQDKQILCVPESMSHGGVELYELKPETLKLNHLRTLIPDLGAADGTLVHHMKRWYFFFTPAHATNTELHIWHADSLEGPFVPHVLNPVKSNVSSVRPAGPFFTHHGKLYRPAQASARTYGGKVIINEIKILSEGEFLEERVNVIFPPSGYSGIHTLSFAGDYLFFDAKKYRFSPASFRHQLLRRLGVKKTN
jgi:hypothetical protein